MTFGLLFLILAQAPVPLKVYFIFGAILVLIVAILVVAYRSFLKSPEPTEDDYSALHIGGNPAAAKPEPVKANPPPKRVAPVTAPLPIPDRTATLRAPAPVDRPIEKKVVGPAIETLPVPEPAISRVEPAVAPPLPIPEPIRTRTESVSMPDAPAPLPPRDVYSPLKEELPQSGRRSLSSPRVFAPTAPRPEPVPPPVAPVPPVVPVQQSQPLQTAQSSTFVSQQAAPTSTFVSQPSRPRVESEVFGSLTETQKRESKSSRATLAILLVAVVIIFAVGYMKVPLFHDTIVGAYDRVTGRAAQQEKIAESPKIEATQKVTYTPATLFIDGVVRNISEDTLDNLYAEVSVTLPNGKLSETRLVPIYEGTPQGKTASTTTEPGKENRSMPPSHPGYYKVELPGSTYHDAQLKRILREDGSDVILQKH